MSLNSMREGTSEKGEKMKLRVKCRDCQFSQEYIASTGYLGRIIHHYCMDQARWIGARKVARRRHCGKFATTVGIRGDSAIRR